MRSGLIQQFMTLVSQGIKAEMAERERLVSPVLFALTLLILFSFALGEVEADMKYRVYLAETFLTAFFALQIAFSRVFEPDRSDRVFDLMRSYPISHTAWFLAKYVHVLFTGIITLLPAMLFGAFLHHTTSQPLLSWVVLGIAVLALAGLAALGVLLSALTLKANARQIIYPLLYFPLTTPVLLAAVQSSLTYLETGQINDAVKGWIWLLFSFDVIYFTLGALLFTEVIDDS